MLEDRALIAIDFIKDKRNYKRVYHDGEAWLITSPENYLIVDDKIIGTVDFMMSRYLEKEFFAYRLHRFDTTWDEKKYHVFTRDTMYELRPEFVQSIIEDKIRSLNEEENGMQETAQPAES